MRVFIVLLFLWCHLSAVEIYDTVIDEFSVEGGREKVLEHLKYSLKDRLNYTLDLSSEDDLVFLGKGMPKKHFDYKLRNMKVIDIFNQFCKDSYLQYKIEKDYVRFFTPVADDIRPHLRFYKVTNLRDKLKKDPAAVLKEAGVNFQGKSNAFFLKESNCLWVINNEFELGKVQVFLDQFDAHHKIDRLSEQLRQDMNAEDRLSFLKEFDKLFKLKEQGSDIAKKTKIRDKDILIPHLKTEQTGLKETLHMIKKAAPVEFEFQVGEKLTDKQLTLNFENMKLFDLLDELSEIYGVEYRVLRDRIEFVEQGDQIKITSQLYKFTANVSEFLAYHQDKEGSLTEILKLSGVEFSNTARVKYSKQGLTIPIYNTDKEHRKLKEIFELIEKLPSLTTF